MGKSTTADMFSEMGCEVWDADRAVHRLYKKDGKAIDPLSRVFPTAIINNTVSREKLKEILAQNPTNLTVLKQLFILWLLKTVPISLKMQKQTFWFLTFLSYSRHG